MLAAEVPRPGPAAMDNPCVSALTAVGLLKTALRTAGVRSVKRAVKGRPPYNCPIGTPTDDTPSICPAVPDGLANLPICPVSWVKLSIAVTFSAPPKMIFFVLVSSLLYAVLNRCAPSNPPPDSTGSRFRSSHARPSSGPRASLIPQHSSPQM
jgi:hypothetical protein